MMKNKLRIEYAAPDARMAPDGEAVLRSLQNNSLPIVDLVIRESFQNGLDAALPDAKYVNMEVNTSKVETDYVANYFEGIEKKLTESLPKETTTLSISDSNTYGLTGEFKTTDSEILEQSNIHKLIYGIFMKQQKENAGGSWGLGKTSYFRIGAGIVVYYSRIMKDDGEYEERLAACLIEDSSSKEAILPKNSRGIAWWGEKENDSKDHDKSYPITDSEFIREFIGEFNVEPYTGEKTGTTIIIPFIEEEKVIPKDIDGKQKNDYWTMSLDKSIAIAIQRWYSPRNFNPKYLEKTKQPYLVSKLNDELTSDIYINDIFPLIRDLYNMSLEGIPSKDSEISVKEIYLKRMGLENNLEPIGRVSYKVISRDDLNKITNPLKYLGFNVENNDKSGHTVMVYSRKPGMIIEYVLDSNEWMKGVKVEENQYVIAFFVPNSEAKLHKNYQEYYATFEHYLRETENADHATWTDISIDNKKVSIVDRMKREVSKTLSADLGESDQARISGKTSALSRQFGKKFLPGNNFGMSGTTKKSDPKPHDSNNVNRRAGFSVEETTIIEKDILKISGDLFIPRKTNVFISINIAANSASITPKEWGKSFDNLENYPFVIESISLEEKNILVERVNDKVTYSLNNDSDKGIDTKLSLAIKFKDQTMQPVISIKKER